MSDPLSFSQLSLPAPLLKVLKELGYESPTPIQAKAIPLLLEGRDLIGQAQTGTGKTGAFALPLLTRLDLKKKPPQVLVLTPTRELAIQVAEAFQTYARNIHGFHVLPVYGGQGYELQLKGLSRGAHVIVGTPGRILDHLRRGSLKTDQLSAVVLDEADEMLRMGFIDDVELIISGAPKTCQMAMFSATMPAPIRRIAKRYLKEPIEIKIASRTSTVESVEQHYLLLNDNQKLDALTRLLEVKEYDGVLIFVRTKSATTEVAEKLEARGFAVSALNGDMSQAQREKAVLHLKQRKLDIVVATDVAARGLDVERLSLVINFDIPNCTESYVHRIGRTARAGRVGQTILFTTTRERGLLRAIENATKQKIEPMRLPSSRELAQRRTELFKERIVHTIANQSLDFFQEYLGVMQKELDMPLKELASALLYLAQKDQPLQVEGKAFELVPPKKPDARPIAPIKKFERPTKDKKRGLDNSIKFERYRLEVGKKHKVRVADIVGAIVNEAEIESRFIGDIRLYDDYSTIELPAGMPKGIFQHLKKLHVRQIKLNISLMTD